MPVARASSEAATLPEPALTLDLASAPGLARIVANLALVLGAIVLLAFIARRSGAVRGDTGGDLKVHASLALGPKERLMIVEAAGERVLIGAGSNGLTALHVLRACDETPADAHDKTAFGRILDLRREASS
ncbi:MAG: flagellar biosynthetic protein FliO [Pseudomonadota bacterium]